MQDLKIFGVQKRPVSDHTRRPYVARWMLDGRHRSRAFRTKAEAERFRSLLFEAQRRGEAFDPETAEPVSWRPLPGDLPVHEWVRRYLAEQWPEWQPRTRASAVEALARLVPLLVSSAASKPPKTLRKHLVTTLGADAVIDEESDAERWLQRYALPMNQLNRDVLALAERKLVLRADGVLLAPSTASRYRKVGRACISRAVELEIIPADPWPPAPRGRNRRKATRSRRSIHARALPSPATMAKAIEAIASHQPASRTYQLMTAVAYYAGLRPSEVVMLRRRALVLPDEGWGRIDVREADVSFDEPGEPKTGPRTVPIPPVLVAGLRHWVDGRELEPDELLFRTRTGRRPTASNWSRAWQRALRDIDHAPLRIYDCRHAAATTWLGAGVPLAEVARRMGHSVETLVTTYVGALPDDEQIANRRIEALLA